MKPIFLNQTLDKKFISRTRNFYQIIDACEFLDVFYLLIS